jgi:hypothetical protein
VLDLADVVCATCTPAAKVVALDVNVILTPSCIFC